MQLSLFSEFNVTEIRKQVIKEFERIDGEDYHEWLEVIRIEVDYRLSLIPKKTPKYTDITQGEKEELKNILDFKLLNHTINT